MSVFCPLEPVRSQSVEQIFLFLWLMASVLIRRPTCLRSIEKVEKFCETRLVRLAGRAIPVLVNPFGMLFAQGVVNLVLKLNVRANFAIAARRRVHFHM